MRGLGNIYPGWPDALSNDLHDLSRVCIGAHKVQIEPWHPCLQGLPSKELATSGHKPDQTLGVANLKGDHLDPSDFLNRSPPDLVPGDCPEWQLGIANARVINHDPLRLLAQLSEEYQGISNPEKH